MERTFKLSQTNLKKSVDIQTARKMFDLVLPDLGPYSIDYTRNGKYLLLGGRAGHVALLDWTSKKLVTEFQARETIKDVKFLHSHELYAVAQKRYTHIYDARGMEIHCLKRHAFVNQVEYLPYHWLLGTASDEGTLRWQDVSTGELVAEHRPGQGPLRVMRQNPRNAILCVGHTAGFVTMWTPNLSKPVVTLQCHQGPVTSLAVDRGGFSLATTGADRYISVWDIRMMKKLFRYHSLQPATAVDISQRGLLAVGYGTHVQLWQDGLLSKAQLTFKTPYMNHDLLSKHFVNDLLFCPYEDVLGIGHSEGFSSVVVPGAGEPNFDSFEADPYQTTKQRREWEVVSLLEKLRSSMITLDPTVIGQVDTTAPEILKAEADARRAEKQQEKEAKKKKKNKTKGKDTIGKRLTKKDERRVDKHRKSLAQDQPQARDKLTEEEARLETVASALDRFKSKPNRK